MPTRICAVGYDKKDPLSQLAEAYLVRGGKRLGASIVPVAEAKRRKNQNDEDHRQFEGEKLLAASERCCRIAMDAQGQMLDSEAFAKLLSERYNRGQNVAFLIGGATGLSDDVKNQSDVVLSLSPMTLPHRLALCFLAEQLYRASEIWRGGPYHK